MLQVNFFTHLKLQQADTVLRIDDIFTKKNGKKLKSQTTLQQMI